MRSAPKAAATVGSRWPEAIIAPIMSDPMSLLARDPRDEPPTPEPVPNPMAAVPAEPPLDGDTSGPEAEGRDGEVASCGAARPLPANADAALARVVPSLSSYSS